MVNKSIPPNFQPKYEIVGCFCEYKGKILLLHRHDHKPQPNTWALPAGKLEVGETPKEAMLREIEEETGFNVPAEKLVLLEKSYVNYISYDFIFYLYIYQLTEQQQIRLREEEHKQFAWVTPEKALEMDLIDDLEICIRNYYLSKNENL